MRNAFYTYHPAINILYFALIIMFTMFFMHPVCLVISLGAAFAYSLYLQGKRALRFNLLYMLPMLLFTALINPLFNHQGVTILGYFRNGNPLTGESIVYGLAAAVMLVAVITWFSCVNIIVTTDKMVYLFGRMIPALSLILSMVLRFVPRFSAQLRVVAAAQRGLGRDITSGNWWQRVRHGAAILSVMITWSLESAVETADSMKSRGYGLGGRTAFSLFRFDQRDAKVLAFMLALSAYILWGAGGGELSFHYFPMLSAIAPGGYSFSLWLSYLALGLMPLLIDLLEDSRWKRMQLNI